MDKLKPGSEYSGRAAIAQRNREEAPGAVKKAKSILRRLKASGHPQTRELASAIARVEANPEAGEHGLLTGMAERLAKGN